MQKEQFIMFDSPEAAQYRENIKGWVSSDGRYWGDRKDSEEIARYAGCTHRKCRDCDKPARKSYLICDDCNAKRQREAYLALPYKEYDGSPVYSHLHDEYFFSQDDLESFVEDLDEVPDSIDLVFLVPSYYSQIDADNWADNDPEDSDGELPKEMQQALDKLNEIISRMAPQCYYPGQIRTSYKVEKEVKP